MAKAAPSSPAPSLGEQGWLSRLHKRQTPLDSAIVAFPLFVLYQIGIVVSNTKNGADIVTRWLLTLSQADLSLYIFFFAIAVLVYIIAVWLLAKSSSWNRKTVPLTLIESSIYALSLGSLISLVMHGFADLVPGLAAGAESQVSGWKVLIVAAGAGVHEELIFRVIGVGLLSSLLSLRLGKTTALALAVLASSIAFSFAHHVGSLGEAFSMNAFVFRTLAGFVFSAIYLFRGAGTAIWTHTLYDVYVLGFLD